MSPSARNARRFLLIAAVALMPAAAAHAQYYSSYPAQQPANPYGAQPYAIEVAPNTYIIRRPAAAPRDPHVIEVPPHYRQAPQRAERNSPPAAERPHKRADRALIEELRKRVQAKRDDAPRAVVKDANVEHKTITKTKIVREKPIVIEHKRIVDDPPRVIERHIVVDDPPPRRGLFQDRSAVESETPLPPPARRAPPAADRSVKDNSVLGAGGEQRVIQADAEVTILGPDRMSIRLFRKGGAEANARAR